GFSCNPNGLASRWKPTADLDSFDVASAVAVPFAFGGTIARTERRAAISGACIFARERAHSNRPRHRADRRRGGRHSRRVPPRERGGGAGYVQQDPDR